MYYVPAHVMGVSLDSEKMEIDLPTIIFENSGGESDLSSADEDDIIDAVYGHGELTMTVCTFCVCVCVCVCVSLCACVLLVCV